MKKNLIYTILWSLSFIQISLAQNIGINTTGAAPDNSAMLDISSTDKGLLIPRMDSTSRINIVTPAEGLMVFDSTYNSFYFYDGTTWTAIEGGADNFGNHVAIQNIQLNGNWLNNDGGATEGIYVDTAGRVGIGKTPTANFEVKMGTNPAFIVTDTSVVLSEYALPIFDGIAGQVLTTNGSGGLTWVNDDAQQLTLSSNSLSLTNGGAPIDLSGYIDNTDAQQLTFNSDTLTLTNGGAPIDLSGYYQQLTLSSNALTLTNGGTPIDLSVYHQQLTLNSDTLTLANGGTPIDLSGYLDNTDAQQLSLSSNSLSLTNGGTPIDLSGYLDNTDAQQLSLSGTNLSLTNGGPPVDLSGLAGADDLGNHTATANIQTNGNWVSNDGDNEGVYVDASGQVGIGTTPQSKFHVDIPSTAGFKVADAGVTINDYTLPPNDGSTNQVLATNGTGTVSWINSTDNFGNHIATQNLQLNDKWLSGDGDSEGIFVANNSNITFKGTQYYFDGTATEDDAILKFSWGNGTEKWQIRTETNGMYGYNGDLVFKSKTGILWDSPVLDVMRIDYLGKVGMGRIAATNRLEVEGNASKSTAGDWLANSDARLKKNILALSSEEMLEKMLSLQGVTYEWNDTQTGSLRPKGIQYGFTAQNIQEVFPTLVEEDNNGFLQTAYGTYDAMTVESIRALNDKIEALENENSALKTQLSKVDELEIELAKLLAPFLEEDKTTADKSKVMESDK